MMAVTRHTYVTREQLQAAAEWQADSDAALADRMVESHSQKVDELFHRRFFPRIYTRRYDYPSRWQAQPGIVWLDDDLLEVTTFTASGEVISSDDYFLYPDDPDIECFDRIELDRDSEATLGSAGQRALVVEGVWGYSRATTPAGTLAAPLLIGDLTIPAASYPELGVGDLAFVGDEAILISDRNEVNEVDTFHLVRGMYGTDAAGHLFGAAVTKNVPRGLIRDLVIAESIAMRVQEDGGYGASMGPGGIGSTSGAENTNRIALLDLRARAKDAYMRVERISL